MFKNIVLFLLISSCIYSTSAQSPSTALKEETNIYEKVYDAPLYVSGQGAAVFNELYDRQPVILALVFTRCSGVCNPFLIKLKETLQFGQNDKTPFQVLVLSFDPRDTPEDMKRLAQNLELHENPQWKFATTDSIAPLIHSVGFAPVWDSLRQQYDHDALLAGINKEGYITKKLIGLRERGDLKLLIESINNVFVPTYRLPNQSTLFSCFNYDPVSGKNKPGLGLIFLALPAVITFILLLSIGLWVGGRRREKLLRN